MRPGLRAARDVTHRQASAPAENSFAFPPAMPAVGGLTPIPLSRFRPARPPRRLHVFDAALIFSRNVVSRISSTASSRGRAAARLLAIMSARLAKDSRHPAPGKLCTLREKSQHTWSVYPAGCARAGPPMAPAGLLSGPQDALQDAAPTTHALGASAPSPARRANSIAGKGAGAPSVVRPVDCSVCLRVESSISLT